MSSLAVGCMVLFSLTASLEMAQLYKCATVNQSGDRAHSGDWLFVLQLELNCGKRAATFYEEEEKETLWSRDEEICMLLQQIEQQKTL